MPQLGIGIYIRGKETAPCPQKQIKRQVQALHTLQQKGIQSVKGVFVYEPTFRAENAAREISEIYYEKHRIG